MTVCPVAYKYLRLQLLPLLSHFRCDCAIRLEEWLRPWSPRWRARFQLVVSAPRGGRTRALVTPGTSSANQHLHRFIYKKSILLVSIGTIAKAMIKGGTSYSMYSTMKRFIRTWLRKWQWCFLQFYSYSLTNTIRHKHSWGNIIDEDIYHSNDYDSAVEWFLSVLHQAVCP